MFELKPVLDRFKELLEREEENTIRNQFDSFLSHSLVCNDFNSDDLYSDFQDLLNLMSNEKMSESKRINSIMNSKFISDVISFKSNAREKELQRITHDLSEFLGSLGHDRKDTYQSTLSWSIKQAAHEIEPRKSKHPKESMNEAWRRELISDVVRRFK